MRAQRSFLAEAARLCACDLDAPTEATVPPHLALVPASTVARAQAPAPAPRVARASATLDVEAVLVGELLDAMPPPDLFQVNDRQGTRLRCFPDIVAAKRWLDASPLGVGHECVRIADGVAMATRREGPSEGAMVALLTGKPGARRGAAGRRRAAPVDLDALDAGDE